MEKQRKTEWKSEREREREREEEKKKRRFLSIIIFNVFYDCARIRLPFQQLGHIAFMGPNIVSSLVKYPL